MFSVRGVAGVSGAAGDYVAIVRGIERERAQNFVGEESPAWGFLVAKIALLLPIVYFVSLDVAYGFTGFNTSQALCLQMATSFFLCLFGMQWALSDQRQRCPVCLRRVAHPARVGQFSRTFLAWSGTEMMCMGGHTLLHVPSLPTSWFSSQRWMFLDPSWEFLFAGPVRE